MKIRFFEITTNTNEGVYRRSDFINVYSSKFWDLSDLNHPNTLVGVGSYNFDATDNISDIVINVLDFAYPHRITHVVAETLEVEDEPLTVKYIAYAVDSVEYLGNKQIRLNLVEDVFLSHMGQVLNSRLLINRTNDYSRFLAHDVADLAYTRVRSLENIFTYDYTGKWVIITLAVNADDYSGMFVQFRNLVARNYEQFNTIPEVLAKYPEQTNIFYPNAFDYYGKIVTVNTTDLYQCQFNIVTRSLTWIAITASIPDYGTVGQTEFSKTKGLSGWIGPSVKLISGDILTVNLAFPLADNIYCYGLISVNGAGDPTYGYRYLPSIDRVEDIFLTANGSSTKLNIKDFIISKRIVTGLAFGEQGAYRPSGASASRIYCDTSNIEAVPQYIDYLNPPPHNFYQCVGLVRNLSNTIDFNFTALNVTAYEPFTNYYLSVFGKSIPIKGKFNNHDIFIKTVLSSTNWNVIVYVDNQNNVIHNEIINVNMPYSLDKYEQFLAENSTYNTSKWVNTILGGGTRVVGGALSGFLAGNVGGAVVGAVAGTVSLGQELLNYDLSEKSLKNAPDSIKGDSGDFNAISINPYGVYFYKMTVTGIAFDSMKIELDSKGFPVSIVTTIDSLANTANSIYGECKLLVGRCVDMIHNYHITSLINNRLRAGLVMLKDITYPLPSEE